MIISRVSLICDLQAHKSHLASRLRTSLSNVPFDSLAERGSRRGVFEMGSIHKRFVIGQWTVNPADGLIENGNESRCLQPRVMALLCRFAAAPGELLSRDQLITDVWEGRAMSDEPLHRCIAELRAALGDDCNAPRYIETLPRRGYRLVASVSGMRTSRLPRILSYLFFPAVIILAALLSWHISTSAEETPRLLVLPLQSLSVEQDHQLLADGLTEELINALNQRVNVVVMSRTTTFSFRNDSSEALQMRKQLAVDYLVEGSIRIVGDSLRVTVQLVDAVSREQLSAQVYTQPLSVVSEVLATIATEVAREIGRSLDNPATDTSMPGFAVYRQFLEGQHLWQQDNVAAARQAVMLLESVTAAEPSYAPAHANLAAAYYTLRNFDVRLPEYDIAIDRHIASALERDPRQPLARALKAVLLEDNDPIEALRILDDVVRTAPTTLRARRWYAQMLYRAGYVREALQHVEYIYEHDPLSPDTVGWLSDLALANGDHATFLQLVNRSDAMKWNSSGTLLFYRALRRRDKVDAAVQLKKMWSHSTRVTEEELQLIVDAIFDQKRRPEANALVHDMLTRDRPITRFWGFVWLDLLGDHDAAIDLQLAENHPRDIRVMYSAWHLEHRDLRRHPRFMQLIEKFNLQAVWAARGENDFCARRSETYVCE